jgi:hypothetical protein
VRYAYLRCKNLAIWESSALDIAQLLQANTVRTVSWRPKCKNKNKKLSKIA